MGILHPRLSLCVSDLFKVDSSPASETGGRLASIRISAYMRIYLYLPQLVIFAPPFNNKIYEDATNFISSMFRGLSGAVTGFRKTKVGLLWLYFK